MARTTSKLSLPRRRASLPDINASHVFSKGPKHLQPGLSQAQRTDMPGEVPAGLVATKPEWCCYWALLRLGKVPDVDFSFQSSMMGGRLELGGVVLDFLLYNPPFLGINIQGIHWHYNFGGQRREHDAMERIQIESRGVKLIYIDEDMIERNPIYYTQEALKGIDHSRMEV